MNTALAYTLDTAPAAHPASEPEVSVAGQLSRSFVLGLPERWVVIDGLRHSPGAARMRAAEVAQDAPRLARRILEVADAVEKAEFRGAVPGW